MSFRSKSISYLEDYFDRTKSHTASISLKDESVWMVSEMLRVAVSSVRDIYPGISVEINVSDADTLYCDRVHMTEVFVNIIKKSRRGHAWGRDGRNRRYLL